MKKSKDKKSSPVGRPSKYKEEYCQMIIDHMKRGLSIESFAGVVGVHKDTIYEWKEVHPEFSDALKQGEAQSLLFWELLGIDGANGKIPNFSASSFIFNMKNRFDWKDKKEIKSETKVTEFKIGFADEEK